VKTDEDTYLLGLKCALQALFFTVDNEIICYISLNPKEILEVEGLVLLVTYLKIYDLKRFGVVPPW